MLTKTLRATESSVCPTLVFYSTLRYNDDFGTIEGDQSEGSMCHVKEGTNPFFIIYFGVKETGLFYQRFVYGYMDLLSKAGGLLAGLYRGFIIVAFLLCQISVNSQLVRMIFTNSESDCDDHHHHRDKLVDNINSIFNFQIKYFIHRICCCGRNSALRLFGVSFYEQKEFYESSVDDIKEELTVEMYM